jgi:hypothetical protein
MRRLLISMAALSFLGALIGCEHTAGICDCNCPGFVAPAPAGGGPLRPEPLIMPKENDAKPVAAPMDNVKPMDLGDK